MTPHERQARADRAKAAMDEFFAPAFKHVEDDYAEKMITAAASTDPRAVDVIARLANGIKAARSVRGLIEAFIADGVAAEAEIQRSAQISRMSPHKRTVVGV